MFKILSLRANHGGASWRSCPTTLKTRSYVPAKGYSPFCTLRFALTTLLSHAHHHAPFLHFFLKFWNKFYCHPPIKIWINFPSKLHFQNSIRKNNWKYQRLVVSTTTIKQLWSGICIIIRKMMAMHYEWANTEYVRSYALKLKIKF
jgi:hypothetical protein